jgi:ClpP class serine protease
MIHNSFFSSLLKPWAILPEAHAQLTAMFKSGAHEAIQAFNRSIGEDRLRALARRRSFRSRGERSMLWANGDEDMEWFDPYYDPHIRPSGVAVVPIRGVLLDRANWCYTGYDVIEQSLRDVMAEREARMPLKDVAQVKAIVIPCDSPGGVGIGQTQLCGYMRMIREEVPVYWVVDQMTCSAAQVLALQASLICVNPDSMCWHYGSYIRNENFSALLAKEGISVEYHALPSDSKVFFAPDVPVSDKARAIYESQNAYGFQQMLLEAELGAGLDENFVRSMDARIFMGLQAIDAGIAQKNLTFTELLNMIEQ